ncbi:MAG: hypothetical protein Q7J07_02925 [Pelolinea sp.]|nr:hypothetical protein [Pelolinea sp.]
MVTSRKYYIPEEVSAAKSVLIEVMHILGDYRDEVILVGGWVPEMFFPKSIIPHVGSNDVDILLNHNEIDNSKYKTIKKLLENRGYFQSEEQPFIFYKRVIIKNGSAVTVQVDFLSGEFQGTGKNRRTQKVQDMKPRKVRGGDLAYTHTENIKLCGKLPNGTNGQVDFKIVALPAFIIMKGIALKNRMKEKDAFDIYFCLLQFGENIKSLTDKFTGLMNKNIVQESLTNLKEAFLNINSYGPTMIADFEEVEGEERERIIRDSYERMNMFLSLLKQ